jgi:Concanavalin A-like lectin/glucanases superfamily
LKDFSLERDYTKKGTCSKTQTGEEGFEGGADKNRQNYADGRHADGGSAALLGVFALGIPRHKPKIAISSMRHFELAWGVLAVVLGGSIQAEGSLANGLVAYYPFNGNAHDESGNGNDGIVHEAIFTTNHLGNTKRAYYFDGATNYIDVGNPVGNNPRDLTQTAWVKIVEGTPFYRDTIITKRQAEGVGASWASLCIGGALHHPHKAMIAVDDDWYVDDVVGTSTIAENTWVFLCGVKRGNLYQIYVNGMLENSRTDDHLIAGSPYNMHFMHHGAWEAYRHGGFCNGVLGEVRIYSRALSANEVRQLYTMGIARAAALLNDTFNPAAANLANCLEPVSRPELSVMLSGGNVVLSWPAFATGYRVYTASNLVRPVVWSPLTNTIWNQGTNCSIVLHIHGEKGFFRLQQ